MPTKQAVSPAPSPNQEAYLLLLQLLDRVGLSKRGFLELLADLGYVYTEDSLVSWGRPGRSFPRDWPALRAMIRVLTEHQPPHRRCTAVEALRFLSLVSLPFDELQPLADFFAPEELSAGLSSYLQLPMPRMQASGVPSGDEQGRQPGDHGVGREAALVGGNGVAADRTGCAAESARLGLPTPLTGFVGRTRELQQLRRYLQTERLISILGPGGVGKTRLALQAAWLNRDCFVDGVAFVSLASISQPDLIISTIAHTLQLALRSGSDPTEQLVAYLRDKGMLLILDNFEHLLAGAGLMAELLTRAPRIHILMTSRERLNVYGEVLFELAGLSLAAADDGAKQAEAVQLFAACARRMRADFTLTPIELSAVQRLCRLVEGSPLGIELAAAWVRTYTCQEIMRELEQSLDFLNTGLHGVPERQRSLRAAFEHSWLLLSASEREMFRCLSVFRGPIAAAAAARVAAARPQQLTAFVDKSLLRRNAAGRYEFHEVVHQYAAAKLREAPDDWEHTHTAHCTYYAEFVHRQVEHLRGKEQESALAEIEAEIENIRAGWQWALGHRMVPVIGQYLYGLALFYKIRSWSQESAAMFGEAVGIYRLLTLEEQSAARADHAYALRTLATARVLLGAYELASQLSRESLELYRELRDHYGIANCLSDLGNIAHTLGAYAEAKQHFEESLAIRRAIGDQNGVAVMCNNLGNVAYLQGEYEEAQRFLEAGLAISQSIGDSWVTTLCLDSIGYLAYLQERYDAARPFFEQSLALSRTIGNQWGAALSLSNLGQTACALDDDAQAAEYFEQALRIADAIQAVPLILDIVAGLAALRAKAGDHERALVWLALILAHPASERETCAKATRQWDALARRLPPAVVLAAGNGGTVSLDAVLRELLQ
jgi:predicted ATPase/Tfp pilus assembly protein PilF